MNFPDNCIRGIPNNTFLNMDGSVGSHLFHFDVEIDRGDGWTEQSINWEDDDFVIEFTLSQKKTGRRFSIQSRCSSNSARRD